MQYVFPGYRDANWEFLASSARKIGFCAVGVSASGSLSEKAEKVFSRWIAHQHNADMTYMEDNLAIRLHPGSGGLLEGAVVVVSAALAYGNGLHTDRLWPSIAAHARGRDYHRTMTKRLSLLATEIQARFPHARLRICVDSAPVQERYWAVKCGLGTIGLNGAVLVQNVGPCVLLGEIICAEVPLPIAEPAGIDNNCLDCGRCVMACPTAALNGDGTLDSRRCLAYHSVENRSGEVPESVAGVMEKIFGCDICTTSCPRCDSSVVSGLEPATQTGLMPETIEQLLTIDASRLNAALAGTCMKRTGESALRRNARIVLRNTGKESL